MKPYHFALLRYVHHAGAGEFVNIGVVMWLPKSRELLFALSERYGRLSKFFSDFDGAGYRQLVRDLQSRLKQLAEKSEELANAGLEAVSGVIPADSSCFAHSELMGGVAESPQERLQQLYYEFVGRYEGTTPRERRDEAEIMVQVDEFLRRHNLADRVRSHVEVQGAHYAHSFRIGWQNGVTQVLEPISFDYLSEEQVLEKANTWTGKLINLDAGKSFRMTGVVSAPQRSDLMPAFDQALEMLRAAPGVRALVREEQLEDLLPAIQSDLSQVH